MIRALDRDAPELSTTGIAVRGLRVDGSGAPRLGGVDLEAAAGEVVAVIGPSGAGKSTLLQALAGVLPLAAGGGQVADFRLPAGPRPPRPGTIGYAPQVEAVHQELTPRAELRYAARLADRPDPDSLAGQQLAALDLVAAADRPIGRLSGGERRRVGLALATLAAPPVLLLDEVDTGLDPWHERQVADYLRVLADRGHLIVLATHSTTQLTAFDRVLLLDAGGSTRRFGLARAVLADAGPPPYLALFDSASRADPPPRMVAALPDATTQRQEPVAVAARRSGAIGFRQQTRVVAAREFHRLIARRRTLTLLIAQAPVLGVLIRLLASGDGLGLGALSVNLYARRMIVTAVLGLVWIGAADAIRMIVADRAVIRRERVAGVGWPAVLTARVLTLATLCAVQALLVTVVAFAGLRTVGHAPLFGNAQLGLLAVGWLAALCSGCLALAISALAASTDRALAVLPIVLVPQLVLSGGLVALGGNRVLDAVSYLTPARWAMSAAASVTHLRELETRTIVPVPVSSADLAITRHEDASSAWDPTPAALGTDLAALVALGAAGLGVAGIGLRRRR